MAFPAVRPHIPTLGENITEQDLWALTDFVKKLPSISPSKYRQLRQQLDRHPMTEPEADESHGGG